jgi:hypothetical protein
MNRCIRLKVKLVPSCGTATKYSTGVVNDR